MQKPKDSTIDFDLIEQELMATFKWASQSRKGTSSPDSHRRECASISVAAARALVELAAERRIRGEAAAFTISKPGH